MSASVNLVVVAGFPDKKLLSKIRPLCLLEEVNKVFLVTRHSMKEVPAKVALCQPPHLLRKNLAASELWRLLKVAALCMTKDIRLIIGIHYRMHCIYAALTGMLFRKKYIFLIIENPRLYDTSRLFWFFCKHAFRIGVRGNKSKQYMASKGAELKKIFIPPNVYDFTETYKMEGEAKVYDLLYIGFFYKEKRLDVLLEALSIAKQRIAGIRLALCGNGIQLNDLQSRARKLHIEENVVFIGYNDAINPIINRSKILILTSESEGLPMVLVEAMACGVPCIVPDVGDITDVAIHEYNALVVEPLNVQGFADAILKLLLDEKLYNRLSENALKIRTEKKYEYSLENLVGIWKRVLAEA